MALQAGVGVIFDQTALTGALGTTISLSLPPVDFDTALDTIVRSAGLEYRVRNSDAGVPIVIIGERAEIETKYGLDVIKIIQIDYANPTLLFTILGQLEMEPGAFAYYMGPMGGGNMGGGGGGFGGGGSGFGGGGSGGFGGFSSTLPDYSPTQFGGIPGGGGGGGGGLGGGGGGFGGGGTGGGGGFGGGGQGGSIFPAKGNKLILRGTPELIETIEDMIRKLDKPPRQVDIQVQMFTLDHGITKSFGLSSDPSQNQAVWDRFQLTFGTSVSLAILGRNNGTNLEDYTAALSAALNKNQGRVLSTPRVVCSDGIPCFVNIQQTTPFITTSTIFVPDGNGGTTITENTTVNQVDTGVQLQLTPNIDDEGRVTLFLSPSFSEITGFITVPGQAGSEVPATANNSVQTLVVLKDGETLVLGGLSRENVATSINKFPWLGDVPILGKLFTKTDTNTTDQEVLFLITVRLINSQN